MGAHQRAHTSRWQRFYERQIRDVFDQRVFTIGRPEQDYGPFNQLLTDRINTRLITDNWDEVLRLAASIRHAPSRLH